MTWTAEIFGAGCCQHQAEDYGCVILDRQSSSRIEPRPSGSLQDGDVAPQSLPEEAPAAAGVTSLKVSFQFDEHAEPNEFRTDESTGVPDPSSPLSPEPSPKPPEPSPKPPEGAEPAKLEETEKAVFVNAAEASQDSEHKLELVGESVAETVATVTPAEDEEQSDVDMRRETRKSAAAAIIVLLLSASALIILLTLRQLRGQETCSVNSRFLRSCEVCGGGTNVFPIGGDWEKELPAWLRCIMYFMGMIWCFQGTGMICDDFMASIEVITARQKSVWVTGANRVRRKVHVLIWNGTLANLSLMALGSSAPEIMLSSVELITNNYVAGSLGPQTVVGSAAFNLFVITAVCISAIPVGETRKIDKLGVFTFTAATSVLAYVWILVMLVLISPDRVEIWEGALTLLMFFAFIGAATGIDMATSENNKLSIKEETEILQLQNQLYEEYGKPISLESARTVLHYQRESVEKQSRSALRAACVARCTGGLVRGGRKTCVGFKEAKKPVLECAGTAKLAVAITGSDRSAPVTLSYATRDGLARAGERYEATSGMLRFEPHEDEKEIEVRIVDNKKWDPLEEFFVDLSNLQIEGTSSTCTSSKALSLGCASCSIFIVNEDEPGTLDFESSEVSLLPGSSECVVTVSRSHGSHGKISCEYEVVAGSAALGEDVEEKKDVLEFEDGQESAMLRIQILRTPEAAVQFSIILQNPSDGVLFDLRTDGGRESAICTVTMESDQENQCLKYLHATCSCDPGETMVAFSQWREKFSEVFFCNGSPEEQAEAGILDWVSHCLALPWKIVFLVVPPPTLGGAWPAFLSGLVMIGLVTVLLNDIASLLGCSIGMSDDVTAITLVALGTSLPDTMASRAAAKQDENADNSIGNVTGSNAVNVFLGLGISWTIGAIYWANEGPTEEWLGMREKLGGQTYREQYLSKYPDGGFMVPAGPLLQSVGLFTAGALMTVSILFVRRRAYGGELGGPRLAQMRDSVLLCLLWIIFIVGYIMFDMLG